MKEALWLILGIVVAVGVAWCVFPVPDAAATETALKQAWASGFNTGADYGAEALNKLRAVAIKEKRKGVQVSRDELRALAAKIYLHAVQRAKEAKDGEASDENLD